MDKWLISSSLARTSRWRRSFVLIHPRQSGSSLATALASGVAALLLYITQLAQPQRFEELKDPEKMRSAFVKLRDTNKYFRAQDYSNHILKTWTGG